MDKGAEKNNYGAAHETRRLAPERDSASLAALLEAQARRDHANSKLDQVRDFVLTILRAPDDNVVTGECRFPLEDLPVVAKVLHHQSAA